MKKRILSLLLVLTLLVTVSVLAVEANDYVTYEEAIADYYDGSTGQYNEPPELTFYCEHCKVEKTWTLWTGSSSKWPASSNVNNEHYHLYTPDEGISNMTSKVVYCSICLYLGGDITSEAVNTTSNNAYMFRLYNDKVITAEGLTTRTTAFSIMGTGTMYSIGDYGSGVIVNVATNGGSDKVYHRNEVNLYDGVTLDASGTVTTSNGGTVALSAANATANVFNMYGGIIKNGTGAYGGNVYIGNANSTFNMYDGQILNGNSGGTTTGRRGGNVYVSAGTFNMYGGTIEQPSAFDDEYTTDTVDYVEGNGCWIGDNVAVVGSSTFLMDGAEAKIKGGVAGYGAGLAVIGTAKVDLNKGTIEGGRGTTVGGCVWNESANFTLNGATIENGMGNGAALGVGYTTKVVSGTIKGGAATNGGAIFVRGGANTGSRLGDLQLSGGVVEGSDATNGGAIYCATPGARITISKDAVVNGGTATSGGNIYVKGSARAASGSGDTYKAPVYLTIEGGVVGDNDNSEENSVVGGSAKEGGNIYGYYCDMDITGGYIGEGQATTDGGNIWVRNSYVDITGGTVADGVASDEGGNVAVCTTSSFTMDGGEVLRGTAKNGGNVLVYNNATMTLKSGTIALGNATSYGGNIYSYTNNATYPVTVSINGGLVAAGTAGSFGGNINPGNYSTVNIAGGEITTAYTDSKGNHKGDARNGDNIGAWTGVAVEDETSGLITSYTGTATINVSGGTISGGDGKGSAINVGSKAAINVNISGGNIHDAVGRNGTDIHFTSTESTDNNGLMGMDDNGILTMQDGFTGKLTVSYSAEVTLFPENNGVVNSLLGVAEGYTNEGQVIIECDDVQYPVVGSGTELVLAEAAIFDGKNVISIPVDAQAAVETALGDGQYVKLFNAPAELALNLKRATTVDFNGNDATVTLNGYVLTGMDAQTDDYTAEGAATVTVIGEQQLDNVVDLTIEKDGQPVNGQRKYLYLDGGFHRYYLSMDKAGLRTDSDISNEPGITYSGVFRGDEVVAAAVDGYGVEFQVNGNKTPKDYMDPQYGGMTFKATERNEGKLLAVHGMMNKTHESTEVTAYAYITIGEDTIYSTESASNNLKALVEGYAADYHRGNLATAFQAPIAAMLEKYGDDMRALDWIIDPVPAA